MNVGLPGALTQESGQATLAGGSAFVWMWTQGADHYVLTLIAGLTAVFVIMEKVRSIFGKDA